MQGRRAALKFAGVVTACLLAFTACGGNPEPSGVPDKPDKSDSEPKTPEGTPTPTPPSPSPVSGESESWTVVRQYEATKGYAFRTGDTEPLKELSDPDCQSCQGTIELIEEVYAAGGHFEGDYDGRIDDISGTDNTVVLYVKFGAAKEISEAGAKPKVYEPENRSKTYDMTREGNGWIVAEIDDEKAK